MNTPADHLTVPWWKLTREDKDEDLFECRKCRQEFIVPINGTPLPEECPSCSGQMVTIPAFLKINRKAKGEETMNEWKLVPVKATTEMRAACRVAGKVGVWDDMVAAAPPPPLWDYPDDDGANTHRLVACWNALDGVPIEWIEKYADGKSLKNIIEQSCDLVRKEEELTERLIAMEEENAALKEALKPLAAYAAHYPMEKKYGNRPRSGEFHNVESGAIGGAQIDVEDFHRAAALLNKEKS